MTIPQLPDENAGRARWLKITAAAWLLLVSILAVVNSVGLSRLSEQSQASAQDAHVQALNTRVAELEQQAAASKNQRPSSAGSVVGSACPTSAQCSITVSGRSPPSRWSWSATFGSARRSSIVSTAALLVLCPRYVWLSRTLRHGHGASRVCPAQRA